MASKFSLEASLSMIDRFTGPLKKISSSADSFSNQMSQSFGRVNSRLDAMQKRMTNATKEMAPMAMAATGMVIAGQQMSNAGKQIIGALGSVVEEGKSFEKTMSNLAAISRLDKTSEDFQRLEETAMSLGASTQFSANQVGEGMSFLAMAGFDANQQIAAIPDTLKLAQVGNLDLAEAADIASNTLGAFKMEAGEMNRVANVFAATITRSNVDVRMMADTFKYAAPIARAVGVSIEDLASMTGLLGDVGIQGSQAGTALRAAIIRLAAPPAEAAKSLALLGVSTKDANGNLRTMPSILEDIRKKTENLGSAKKMEAISKIFGVEASAAFSELISKADQSGKSIESFAETIKLAAQADELSKMALDMADNVEGAGLAFDSASSAVKIGIFNSFKDIWKETLQIGSRILLWLYEFIKSHKTLVKWISIIVAVIGGLLVFFGTLITIAGTLAGAFVAMSVAAAMFGVSLSVAIWPVTLVVAAVLLLIAGVALLITYWDNLMNFFRGTPGIIQTILAWLFPFITIPLMIAANWEYLKNVFVSVFTAISNAIAGLIQWFSELNGWIQFAIIAFAPFVGIPLTIAANWDYLYEKVTKVITAIGEHAQAISTFLGMDKWHGNELKASAKAGPSAQSTSSPVVSKMERINREMVDINVNAPPGTSAERKGKKSPNLSLNMGANGSCA